MSISQIKKDLTIIFLVWCILYLWRPFFLGFYADDHNTVLGYINLKFSASQIADYCLQFFVSRPVSGSLAVLLILLARDNPYVWHALGIISVLSISILFYVFFRRINAISKFVSEGHLVFVALFWSAFPFNYGFTAWPIYISSSFAIPFYLLSFYSLIYSDNIKKIHLALSGVFFILCGLSTEVFYFQFLFMVFYLFLERNHFRISLRKLNWIFAYFFLIQIGLVVYNRLYGSVRKNFDPSFILERISFVLKNPQYLKEVFIPVLLSLIFFVYVFRLILNRDKKNFWKNKSQLLLGGIIFSMMTSVLIYFVAGYSIRPFGIGSRTTMAISVLSSFALLVLISNLEKKKLQVAKIASVIILLLGLFQLRLGVGWAKSWALQKDVWSKFPAQKLIKLGALKKDTIIFAFVPNIYEKVNVFGENYSFSPSIRNYFMKDFDFFRGIYIHHNEGILAKITSFKGKQFCNTTIVGGDSHCFNFEQAFIWNYYTQKLYRVTQDITISPHSIAPEKLLFPNQEEVSLR